MWWRVVGGVTLSHSGCGPYPMGGVGKVLRPYPIHWKGLRGCSRGLQLYPTPLGGGSDPNQPPRRGLKGVGGVVALHNHPGKGWECVVGVATLANPLGGVGVGMSRPRVYGTSGRIGPHPPPLPDIAYNGIRSASGRYASY